jgi:hypothetical protein
VDPAAFSTSPPFIHNWDSFFAPSRNIVEFWPTFEEVYARDILSYAKKVKKEAAHHNPRLTQTMVDMFSEEVNTLACSFYRPSIVASLSHTELGLIFVCYDMQAIHLLNLHLITMLRALWDEDIVVEVAGYAQRFEGWTLEDAYDTQAKKDKRALERGLLVNMPDGRVWSNTADAYVY